MLMQAYRQGLFPMARSRHGPIDWYSPDPRAILPLEQFRVSRSLRRRVAAGTFRVTRDVAFGRVIEACAQPRAYASETWINDTIIGAYTQLHDLGVAHSVEAWPAGGADGRDAVPTTEARELVGGLYGVALGGAFFGESMFSHQTDASKVCLVHLVDHLRRQGFVLLDVQFATPHLARFGIEEVPRRRYLRRLAEALALDVRW